MIPDAEVWTDGACDKDGFGGCAAVLIAKNGKRLVLTDGSVATTNQRMELMAAIVGLNRLWWKADKFEARSVRRTKTVVIYSDSAYLVNCFLQEWIPAWRSRGWRKAGGGAVANQEYWETLENLVEQYKKVKFIHIKGHNGVPNNELADQQAVLARESMRSREKNRIYHGLPKPKDTALPYTNPIGVEDTGARRRSDVATKTRRRRRGK